MKKYTKIEEYTRIFHAFLPSPGNEENSKTKQRYNAKNIATFCILRKKRYIKTRKKKDSFKNSHNTSNDLLKFQKKPS
jgi:hypothetical protein